MQLTGPATAVDLLELARHRVALARRLAAARRRATERPEGRRAAIHRAMADPPWPPPGPLEACVRCGTGTVWAHGGAPRHPWCAP